MSLLQQYLNSFSRPWCAALLALPLLYFFAQRYLLGLPPALLFSNARLIVPAVSWRTSTRWIPNLLLTLAWMVFSVAMMGPRIGRVETEVSSEGVAINMVVDGSGSMVTPDMPDGDRLISRIEMAQSVFHDFLRGNEKRGLPGRKNDMVGLVSFDRFVQELCPLTLDHAFLADLMKDFSAGVLAENERLQSVADPALQGRSSLNGTAVYDGALMASDLLRKTEKSLANAVKQSKGNYTIRSKILILLTDGEDNASHISEENAAKAIREAGVKVYAIAVHGRPVQRDVFGMRIVQGGEEYDDSPLRALAETTGGRFYRADDPESLARICQAIDRLEKSEFARQVTTEYDPVHRPWIMAGLLLLAAGQFLAQTLYRVLP